MPDALLSVVESHPFVAGLEPRHIQKLASMARDMCFDTGVVIFPEGDSGREFYLLVKGMVGLEITSHGGVLRVQTLYAGDEFGWSAVLTGKSKVLQARALSRADVLVFDGVELLEAFKEDPAFGLAFTMRLLGVVSERLSATREQLLDFYAPESKRAGT
ncbi:MAG: Crp/Fnr family transcriptional regulator [Gemmatimonadaceae bacterium]|nr:Crp/Fnr family transcriptional regulator [Gemmatimonadaceae bacterium]